MNNDNAAPAAAPAPAETLAATLAGLRDRMVADIVEASRDLRARSRGPFDGLGLGWEEAAVPPAQVELRRAQYAVGGRVLLGIAELLQLEGAPAYKTLRRASNATEVVSTGLNYAWDADLDRLSELDLELDPS